MTRPLRVSAVALAAVLAIAAAAAGASTEADELFQKTREKALDNVRRMPRYTCVESISRSQYRPPPDSPSTCAALITMHRLVSAHGALAVRDKLRLDVAVAETGEIFSWAGAGKFETVDIDKLVGGGVSGSGEFGAFLGGVFGGAPDVIRFLGLRNDYAAFEYNVPRAKSHYTYRSDPGEPSKTIGFHGSFLVDPADADLQQLIVDADDFEPRDPACRVEQTMNYQRVKIGTGDFLLPEISTMKALYHNGSESANETRYSGCREYVGESTIRFDDVDPAAETAATAKAAARQLPPKTRMQIALAKPLDTEAAAAGDEVTAVGTFGRETAPVHGRILRLVEYMEPAPHWVIAIRFEAIDRGGATQPLTLKPPDMKKPSPFPDLPPDAGVFTFDGLPNRFSAAWETR